MKFFLSSILLLVVLISESQNFNDNGIHLNQQLTKEVYQVFCDSKGFVWLGYNNGLVRFDGNRFQSYNNTNQNSLGISNICEDANGNIWCRNFGGQIFYTENNALKILHNYDWKNQLSFPSFFITKQNKLVASHQKGLFVYDINLKKSQIISTPSGSTVFNFSLHYFKDKILVIDNHQLLELTSDNSWKRVEIKLQNPNSLYDYLILLGQSEKQLFLINNKTDSGIALGLDNNILVEQQKFNVPKNVFNIYNFNNGLNWVCSKSLTYTISNNIKIADSVIITSLSKDKFNNIWYSSLNNGFGLFSQLMSKKQQGAKINEAIQNPIAIENFNNTFVAATKNNTITFSTNEKTKSINNVVNEPLTFLYKTPKSLYAGGTYLYQIDIKNKTIDTITETSSVKDIDVDVDGNVLVANSFSLMKVTSKKQKIIINNKRCKAVKVDVINKLIYGAFANGLYAYDNNTNQEILFNNQSIFVNSLAISKDTLVASTISNGILFIVNKKVVKHIFFQQQLNDVLGIKLKYYHPFFYLLNSKQIIAFNFDGIKTIYTNNEIESLSNATDFCLYQNNINAVVNNQLHNFTPSTITQPPIVFLDNVTANNKEIVASEELHHSQNNIAFYFGALTMQQGNKFIYQYRLLETDTNFTILPSSKNSINFNSLQPGKYSFQIRAVDYWGNQSNIISFNFIINKPWWQTLWFITASVLLLLILGYIIAKYLFKSQQQKNLLLLEKLNLENNLRDSLLTAIKSQMNPHFIFNALNTIQSYIYTNDEDKASNYLGKFSDLIRQILDHSQNKTISLAKEIETLKLYTDLEMMRFENTLQVNFKVDESLLLDNIKMPTMLIQPYVENAIKHGLLHKQNNRILNIEFNHNQQQSIMLVVVDDNGIGIKASQEKNKIRQKQHNSFATFANANRLVLLNQTLNKKIQLKTIDKLDDNNTPAGTRVEIIFPL